MEGNFLIGLQNALSLSNLLYCFAGSLLGTLVGVLPGLGPTATMAMLLPLTYYLDPTGAIIMLAGIFYGAMYGGSVTSILLNVPGEASSVLTAVDGHQMTKQGRAGEALAISAIGSFIAGTAAIVVLPHVLLLHDAHRRLRQEHEQGHPDGPDRHAGRLCRAGPHVGQAAADLRYGHPDAGL
jgi:TctA family transporter